MKQNINGVTIVQYDFHYCKKCKITKYTEENKCYKCNNDYISYFDYLDEFLITSMNSSINNSDRINLFVKESKLNNIEVLPPDIIDKLQQVPSLLAAPQETAQ